MAGAFAGLQWLSWNAPVPIDAGPRLALATLGAGAVNGGSAPGAGTVAFNAAGSAAARRQQLALWQRRYMRAEQVYNDYRDTTRYPPESRPIAERPDQAWPFEPIRKDVPLQDASSKPVKGVRIQTTQERLFLVGAESVKFTVAAVNEEGRALPLVIERSVAQSLHDSSALSAVIAAPVPFADDGAAPDGLAGDGEYSALLTPAAQGFARHAGTIRLLVEVDADGQRGVVPLDVIYTPAVPATWAGAREALENGALNFYLQAHVATPGRYIASARVYDAGGVPFALLRFDDVVAVTGPAEFKLTLAGVLVRDKNPTMPLRLVDVEGFLLQPDTFPDRAMMPRLAGEAHVSGQYDVDSFSGDEWQSDERARYLAQYAKDMQLALEEMGKLRQR
jgi:hypothetical protein